MSFNNPEARAKLSKIKIESITEDKSQAIRSSRGERRHKVLPLSGSNSNTNAKVSGKGTLKNNFTKVGSVLLKTCSNFLKVEESRFLKMEAFEVAKRNDPRYVIEYSNDIFRHLKEREVIPLINSRTKTLQSTATLEVLKSKSMKKCEHY